MAKKVEQEWGVSQITFCDGIKLQENRHIHTEGINLIKPHEMILPHLHFSDNEMYKTLSSGMKVLVLPIEEAVKMSIADIILLLKKQKRLVVGAEVICTRGHVHALYNAASTVGKVEFCKYYSP